MLSAKLYLVLLLALFSLRHRGVTVPVTRKVSNLPLCQDSVTFRISECVVYAQALLDNITDALDQDNHENLFHGISFTQQSVELNTGTDTPSVCAPHGTSCSGVSNSHFNQEQCVCSIGEDLHYYYTFLSAHPDPDEILKSTVLLGLRELTENCFNWTLPEGVNPTTENPTYDQRLALYKVLKGFQIRGITINRVLGYMRSGEHSI